MSDLDRALQAKTARLGVVGLGTVGLPLATFAAARGFHVVGFDTDPARVEQINARKIHFEYGTMLEEIPVAQLEALADPARTAAADVIFFCVPTPIDETGRIVLEHLDAAARAVGPAMKRGALVVLESSVEIGTTRWFAKRLETHSGRVAGQDFLLAYCPERYNPGLPSEEHAQITYKKGVDLGTSLAYDHIPRVVGGLNAESARLAQQAYASFLEAPIHIVPSLEVAEAAKLLENIFRDVNIALVNEFAAALDRLEAVS